MKQYNNYPELLDDLLPLLAKLEVSDLIFQRYANPYCSIFTDGQREEGERASNLLCELMHMRAKEVGIDGY